MWDRVYQQQTKFKGVFVSYDPESCLSSSTVSMCGGREGMGGCQKPRNFKILWLQIRKLTRDFLEKPQCKALIAVVIKTLMLTGSELSR